MIFQEKLLWVSCKAKMNVLESFKSGKILLKHNLGRN
jgi:hypothetical protein